MFGFLKRHRDSLLVAFLLLYPLAMFLTRPKGLKERPSNNAFDRMVVGASAPIQSVLIKSIEGSRSWWRHYVALRGVQTDNDALRTETAALRAQVTGFQEARAENQRLRRLVGFADANPGIKIPASVVGVVPDPLRQWVRLDRGEQDGVKAGMAVVTPDGVAGQVMRTTNSASEVMLLTDSSSRVGVRVQRTRSRATATGRGEAMLQLDNAVRSEPLEEGDQLITSGADGVYPPGLVVGRVTALQRTAQGMFWNAGIIPAVNTTKLEEVYVMPAPLSGPVDLSTLGSSQSSGGRP